MAPKKAPALPPQAKPAPVKKASVLDSDDDEDDFKPPAKPVAKAPVQPATAKKTLLEDSDDDDDMF